MSSSSGSAPVELFSTSILGNHKVRSRHERYLSILSVKKIPFVYHDMASDEEAKSRWRRKARDPQIPGLLVHNEWRGTFDEFEEAVEFGELDLFLRIEKGGIPSQSSVSHPIPFSTADATSAADIVGSIQQQIEHKPNPRAPSHTVKLLDRLAQPRAPSLNNLAPTLPFAPSGSGRRKDHDADSFLNSLGISDLNLTEEELNEILEEGKKGEKDQGSRAEGGQIPASSSGERGNGKYPTELGLGSSKPAVDRTYTPSAEAGIKPLRLARMGDGNQKTSFSFESMRTTPSARFNTSHLSSKALAAEAQASISSRAFSSVKLREAVSKGDKLEEAFKSTRDASKTNEKESVVGREDLDDLMSSLGLNDVKMSEEEAEAFLMDGTIPTGLDMHGDRLGRAGSVAEKARNEAAARDLARKAKEKGFGSRPTSLASSNGIAEPSEDIKEAEKLTKGEEDKMVKSVNIDPEQSMEPTEAEVSEPIQHSEEALLASEASANNKVDGEDKPADGEALNVEKGDVQEALIGGKGVIEEQAEAKADMKNTAMEENSMEHSTERIEEEGGKDVEDTTAEETPMQHSVDLPILATSSDSDTTRGKSSTSTVATLLKVEVEPPSDDVNSTMQESKLQSDEPLSDFSETIQRDEAAAEGKALSTNDSTDLAASHDAVELGEVVKDGSKLGEAGVSPLEDSKTGDEVVKPEQTKQEPQSGDELIEQPLLLKEESPLPDVPASQSLVEKSLAPIKTVSPPLDPASVTDPSTSKPSSPLVDYISLSPGATHTSPPTLRRHLDEGSLTPSRRAMDLTRSLSSDSAISEVNSNYSRHSPSSSGLSEAAQGPKLLISPKNTKSPKIGTKKFFGIGRRKSSDKKGDDESSEDDIPTIVPVNDRSQKTLSMILREADEALNGASDDEDEYGETHDDEGAFSLDYDEVEEKDGIDLET